MTSDQTKDVPGVEEQRRMTEEINQRIRERGECAWTLQQKYPMGYQVDCLGHQRNILSHQWKFCPYCGGKLVVK